jgi:SAM-dependent methyltransferase
MEIIDARAVKKGRKIDMIKNQRHLNRKDTINFGSFYTPKHLVEFAYEIISKNISDFLEHTIIDTSCGYGSFLTNDKVKNHKVGVDIDEQAIKIAKQHNQNAKFIIKNSLNNVCRSDFNLRNNEKIIIVGNPPYNDTTSIIRNSIKDTTLQNDTDKDLKTRDLGMSFLLSYNKLEANYVCILHPLSYLIKKSNFALLKNFAGNYKLIDSLIISSHEFSDTSKVMAFPILIGLYKRDEKGMNYNFIQNYEFKVKDDGNFRLSDFDTIVNYVQKYPNKKYLNENDKPVAKFWTLRDINALKRNRTFIDDDTYNTVYVLMEKLAYYCYIDVFKQYADKLPYFLGNCDVIIDNEKFQEIKECFIYQSIKTNSVLKNKLNFREVPNAQIKIEKYFRNLISAKLGEKYITDFN